jgi:peptidyl-dipeptidase Dcp
MPHFDRVRDEHYLPAFRAGMEQHLEEIQQIAQLEEEPTFDNTIVALERTGQLLERTHRVFANLNSAHTNETLQQVEQEVAPLLAAHTDAIYLNGQLFARVDALYQRRNEQGLDAESLRLVERYHMDFVRAGARLGQEQKERLSEINTQLAALTTTFRQNILAETNANAVLVESVEELAGLTESEIGTASDAAKAAGHPGKYLLNLRNTTTQPILVNLQNRELRERVYRASTARCGQENDQDNRPLILQIVNLRAERSQLLGFENAAAYILDDATARTPEAVNDLLGLLAPASRASALREAADIQQVIESQGGDFALQPWDWAFYAEQVRRARYDLDEAALKPYFELNRTLTDGVFFAAEQLFGLRFEERQDLPLYHPDARVWEVFDADGTSIGLFIGDFWARESKRGGAWMNQYVLQSGLLEARPVVGNHLNVPRPPEGQPTLLTLDELETLFHEFGHALHGLLSSVRYPRFGGTSVPRDFVEFPSQSYEIWAFWPEVLANYARHHEDGSPIPQELVDRVMRARKFNQGYDTSEYVAASIIDQAWHQRTQEQLPEAVEAFEQSVLTSAGLQLEAVPPRYHSTYFSHIFGSGYEAAYYSYIWSEVLVADTEHWFQQNGGLTRENGQRLRNFVLSRGGSQEAMDLYRAFAGRDPEVGPLLERRGLQAPERTETPATP